MATWPSGKAEACKAFTPSSNLGVASSFTGFRCVIYFVLLSCYYADVLILGTESKRILKKPMNGPKIRSIKVLAG